MPELKNQVPYKILKNPTSIAVIDNNRIGAKATADKLREDLDTAEIKFSVIDHSPPIIIFIGKGDLLNFSKSGIRIPAKFDRR